MSGLKRILVTGASGFIGRATVSALVDAGWDPTEGLRSSANAMRHGSVHLDLADPSTILALAKKARFDAIVHLGARVGLSGEPESAMYVPNALSTGCLAYLATLWDAHLIYASTAIVHGVRSESISIDSPISTDTAYAKSKWVGEQLLEVSGARQCVLRIAGVFGYGGPCHLGLNRAIDGAIKGESPQQIGSGAALRNYVYVKDVARAIVYVLQKGVAGTHLLAGSEITSVGEMLQQICDMFVPGMHPVTQAGPHAVNQIVVPSDFLPKTRGFGDALLDIRNGCGR